MIDRRTLLLGAAAAGAADSPLVGASQAPAPARRARPAAAPVVETHLGKVRGARVDGVYVFKGVRYGAPTGAENRFMPPQEPVPWSGVVDALEFGHSAPQSNPHPPASHGPPKIILSQLPRPAGAPPQPRPKESEDCLFLNVWTAGLEDGRRRPVMVWLHGGFFAGGSGSSDDSLHLAKRGDVVNVTVNHRLNIFGYCHLADLGGADFAHSGNAGMLDIIAALRWVERNIERFGGDPRRVMVFGVSGGGMKTSFLMASPAAQGLLHRAGIESGPGLRMMERDRASEVSERVLRQLGLQRGDVRAMQHLSAEALLAARFAVEASLPAGNFTDLVSFAPVIDPTLLPHHPFSPTASPLSRDIPLLIGSNQSDMVFFMGDDPGAFVLDERGLEGRLRGFLGDEAAAVLAAYRKDYPQSSPSDLYIQIWSDYSISGPTDLLAQRKAALGGAAVYRYRFDWRTPVLGGKLRSLHSLEVPFVFDNIEGSAALTGGGEDAKRLARRMSEAWVHFAATGDPSSRHSGLPHWPAYRVPERSTLLLDEVSEVRADPQGEARAAIDRTLGTL